MAMCPFSNILFWEASYENEEGCIQTASQLGNGL